MTRSYSHPQTVYSGFTPDVSAMQGRWCCLECDLQCACLVTVFHDEFVEPAKPNKLHDDAVVARLEHDGQQFDDVRMTQFVHQSFAFQFIRGSDNK